MPLLSRARETCALIVFLLVALLVPMGAAAQATFPPAPTVKMAVNPVTNKVYTLNEFANSVTVFDATAGTTKTIAVGARPQYIAINPVTNRVYVNNGSDASLSIIDGATDTNLTVPALGIGSTGPISVDPVHNIIYIVRLTTAASDEVTFFNGDTNTWYTVATESFQPIAMAVNPVTSTIYVAHYATGDIRIISGVFNPADDFPQTFSIGMWSKPFAIAVNPVTNKVYLVIDDSRGPIAIVDGATKTAQFPLPAAGHAVTPKGIAVNPVTNKIYALFAGEVVVIDGATNGYTYVPVATGSGQAEIAVNPVTNKIYVASDAGALTVIDGDTNTASPVTIPSSANALALDPVRNVAYVFGTGVTAVSGSASDVQHPTPVTTSITPLTNNTSGPNATFTLNASTSFASMPANRMYVQLDSRTGPWIRASGSGPFTASFSGMADGSHTLYAFAADGQDAPLSSGDVTIVPGTVASYTFTVSGSKVASSVSLSSSQNPSVVGQSVTFTASIAGGSTAPTGTVDFLDGTATISGCAAVAVASGSATCTTAGLASGTHSITARYSGDASYAASTSGAINQSVGAASAGVTLSTARTPAPAGSTVTFTASVAGNAGTPTGSVTFRDGGTAIAGCTSVALSGGTASCNASFDTGTHNITAAYSGDAVYGPAVSGTLPQVITAVTPNTFLSSSANPSKAGDSVTFTITLSSNAGTPGGTVDFLDGGAAIGGCTGVVLASGSANCTTASLAAGTRSISARYGGDARFAAVTSATLSQTVQAPPAQGAAMSLSRASIDFGGQSMGTTSPAIDVIVSNTGNATLTVDGVSTSDAQFAQTNDCTSVAPGGTCTIHVTFAPAPTGIALGATASVSGTLSVTGNGGGSPATVSLAGSAEKSLVTQFYRAILRRAPDDGGKAFWTSEALRMQQLGANPNETWFAMAAAFYFSPEYLALARDDAGFVSDLYATFFNRPADSGGLSFWTGQLAGGMPRENVLASFMFSPEFAAFTQGIFGNTAARAEVNVVMDFYRGVLGRLPDADGFAYWVQQFRTAQCQGSGAVYTQVQAISSAFLDGAEYANRQRANGQFVGDLYNAFLRRGGDLSGVRFWIDQLDSNAMSRPQERGSFISSPEFSDRVNAVVSQGCQP